MNFDERFFFVVSLLIHSVINALLLCYVSDTHTHTHAHKQKRLLRKHQGTYTFPGWLLARSQYIFPRSYNRSPRQWYSWVPFIFKQIIVPKHQAAFEFSSCSYGNPKFTYLKSLFQIMQLAINRKIKIQRPLSTVVHKAYHSLIGRPYTVFRKKLPYTS
jgi:hypothetical protein